MITNRIRFQLENGQWTYWLNKREVERYCKNNSANIKNVIIEKTMPYEEAMEYLKDFGK